VGKGLTKIPYGTIGTQIKARRGFGIDEDVKAHGASGINVFQSREFIRLIQRNYLEVALITGSNRLDWFKTIEFGHTPFHLNYRPDLDLDWFKNRAIRGSTSPSSQ